MTPAVDAWRMEISTFTENFSIKSNIFEMDPSGRKLQGPRNKQNKRKENYQNCQIMYISNQ